MIEPVSRPLDLRAGVRGTSGRAPEPRPALLPPAQCGGGAAAHPMHCR